MTNFSVLKYFSFFAILRFDKAVDGTPNSVNAVPVGVLPLLEQLPMANLFELIQRRFTAVGDHQYTMIQCTFPNDEEGNPLNFDRIMGFPLGDDLFMDDGDDPNDLGDIREFYGDDE